MQEQIIARVSAVVQRAESRSAILSQLSAGFEPDFVNGDGRPEVVAWHTVAGSSATTEVPYIWQWQHDHFATLFTAAVTSWRGRNHWEAGAGSVSIQCQPMGPFPSP